ncbi:unnamed protein product [Rotaria sp. Silwood1]|nr:unnamed protein product [Rotaria sp. Silwood1]
MITLFIGSGANAMVYRIVYNNIEYAIKISNKMPTKEYDIFQKMKVYMNMSDLNYKIIEIDIKEGFVLSKPVGTMIKNDDICKTKYIIQILKQLAIGQKAGYVHRDIRINNIILDRNDYAYLIDWDSSTFNGFKGEYEGAFITASTPVLKQYSSSNGKEVSAYYADDWVSIIYMILLSRCSKDKVKTLKIRASHSMAYELIYDRQDILEDKAILPNESNLSDYKNEVMNCLYDIELKRENLTNIDDLHQRCMKLIETIFKLGLMS